MFEYSPPLTALVQLQPNEIARAKRAFNSSAVCCNHGLDGTRGMVLGEG
jgi:hypothetical protein